MRRYGCTFRRLRRAHRHRGCGYADGYPRHAPIGTPILVCSKRTRTIARVAMELSPT
jgi:alanine racemase